jgi:hypothetical protein
VHPSQDFLWWVFGVQTEPPLLTVLSKELLHWSVISKEQNNFDREITCTRLRNLSIEACPLWDEISPRLMVTAHNWWHRSLVGMTIEKGSVVSKPTPNGSVISKELDTLLLKKYSHATEKSFN